MAESHTDDGSAALGSRENFFESDSGEYNLDRTTRDDSRPDHFDVDADDPKLSRLAWEMLVAGQRSVCPDCGTRLDDGYLEPREHHDGDDVVELPHTRSRRTCLDCGAQYFRGRIENRSTEQFKQLVETIVRTTKVPDSVAKNARGEAIARKTRGVDDATNVSRLLADLRGTHG